MLPDGDLEIAVVLSSAALDVGRFGAGRSTQGQRAAEGSLVLPRDGSKSRTAEGTGTLRFTIALPEEPCRARARARLSYLFRDTVVQSQQLNLYVMPEGDGCSAALHVFTDFTISDHLDGGLAEITERPRVSVLVNANDDDLHEITIRDPGAGGRQSTTAFRIDRAPLEALLGSFRDALAERAPSRQRRSSRELAADLRTLAPISWRLFSQLTKEATQMLWVTSPDQVVQVALPEGSGFTLPWHLIYDIYVDPSIKPAKIPVCPLVSELDDPNFSFAPGTRVCPHSDRVSHVENLLCPFGFWGFRHTFELLVSTRSPSSEIEAGADPRVLLARTERGVDQKALDAHLADLSDQFTGWSSRSKVELATSSDLVRAGLSADLPFVYFLCHGSHADGNSTVLSVGKNDAITPVDFRAWVEYVHRTESHDLWTSPRPLVFINACESLAIEPSDLVGYLGAFITTARAVGVIGTETKVNPGIAMDVGERFFESLLGGATVGDTLAQIRLAYLEQANLAGLLYTPYCFADLHISAPESVDL